MIFPSTCTSNIVSAMFTYCFGRRLMLMSTPPPLFLCTLKKCSSFYHIKSITFSCVLLICNHHSAKDRFLAKVRAYVVFNVTLLDVLWQSHLKHLTHGRTSLQIVLHASAILQGTHSWIF